MKVEARPDFVLHCQDLLRSVGNCSARRMFGGWGLSVDGLTFAIIADLGDGERLWLKTSAATEDVFLAEGCPRFTYTARGKTVALHYHAAPDEAMESPLRMAPWARRAWDVAQQSAQAPLTPKGRRPSWPHPRS